MTHIFISYAKKDTRELALNLADALNKLDGITAWVDRSLRVGRSWELQIQAEIDRCDTMVVLYSPDINRHKQGEEESYVLTEIAYAKYTVKKPIIPVMAQATTPPMALTTSHYIDFTLNGLTLNNLIEAICDELGIPTTNGSVILVSDPTQVAIQHARQFNGKRNRDWQPYITTFSELKIPDMPFCLVPVGTFNMGSDDGHDDDEQPAHPQTITEPYWLAQYPVTNKHWVQAVSAGAVKEPLETGKSLEWYKDSKMADAPVVGVTWFMARDFANWLGCRLPSELEWEYAARGVENLCYPWEDEWKEDIPIWSKNSDSQPALVTTKPEGASWVGAHHLSGNIWEWTNSLYEKYPYQPDCERDTGDSIDVQRVLRGGSWRSNYANSLCSTCRCDSIPNDRSNSGGFRLARSLK